MKTMIETKEQKKSAQRFIMQGNAYLLAVKTTCGTNRSL
jgi:hypothetical protein